ncbi:hypothetical protein VIGAN_11036100 [Vigna angularis var. angularis]|uniref:Uncharacterized protein n=1 Tax=Vigna angularis var. angularis TaxID=157739 RepID=A0A0S3T7J3_PHAAN|nr:hypothetical protein VIGAN_11036100 [Vigna angularis var. angularis]
MAAATDNSPAQVQHTSPNETTLVEQARVAAHNKVENRESTEGVNFDIRKDVYQGELVPIDVIPAGSFPDDEPAGTPTEQWQQRKLLESRHLRGIQGFLLSRMPPS